MIDRIFYIYSETNGRGAECIRLCFGISRWKSKRRKDSSLRAARTRERFPWFPPWNSNPGRSCSISAAGLVGIAAAKVLGEENVWMTDVDPAAVRCAAENAKRNGVENVHLCCGDALDAVDASGFDWILSNPPYHADFSVAKKFIEKGFNRLKLGGKLVMVVKRELWYRNKLTAIFGGVRMQEIGGYFVFTAEKRSERYAPPKPKAPKTPPSASKKKRRA
mgnify:CR=1 FL=1